MGLVEYCFQALGLVEGGYGRIVAEQSWESEALDACRSKYTRYWLADLVYRDEYHNVAYAALNHWYNSCSVITRRGRV